MGTTRYKLHIDSVICAGSNLEYRYYLSRKRRTLGMTLQTDGSIVVRSPVGVPLNTIRDFVMGQSEWIAKTRLKIKQRIHHQEPASPMDEGFLFLGERYKLRVICGNRESVHIANSELVVTARVGLDDPGKIRFLCERWFRQQAQTIFQERLHVCHELLKNENIALPCGLVTRTMRSRWGSYSYRTHRICLNSNLLKAPPECLDYVMIHELCHARIRHHGADFWNLVGRYVPEYRRVRELLKSYTASE
jgi:predicted metal-dependent hydrolase